MTIKDPISSDPPMVQAVAVAADDPEIVVGVSDLPPPYNPEATPDPPPFASALNTPLPASAPPQPVTTTTYTIPPPAPAPAAAATRPPRFGRRPQGIQCSHCNRQSVTRTRHHIDGCTVLMSILLLFIFWPIFWIPFCIPACKTTDHYCESCGRKVGRTGPCD